MQLVNCSSCNTPLQLPPAATTIRCAICGSITHIASPPGPRHLAPPCVGGRKKAVICGISYKNRPYQLNGCINDAKCIKYLLQSRFRFPESNILMLTEEENDPLRIPTMQNIRMAMAWLVAGCRSGDSLVFHYSGHGLQQFNYYGDEVDGYDETLCPLDFETSGMIVDDEINAAIVRPLPPGVKLHAIIDSCHSGTMLDLPFLCRMNSKGQYVWEDHRPRSGRWTGTSGGQAICFSGCDDHQTAADTSSLSKVTSTGAMTYTFIQAIERGQATTYGGLLNAMKASIRNTDRDLSGGVVTSIISRLLTGSNGRGLKQVPHLSANEPFDVYTTPFAL